MEQQQNIISHLCKWEQHILNGSLQCDLNHLRTKDLSVLYQHITITLSFQCFVFFMLLAFLYSPISFPTSPFVLPSIVSISALAISKQTEEGLKQENHIEEIVLAALCTAALLIQHMQGITDLYSIKKHQQSKKVSSANSKHC